MSRYTVKVHLKANEPNPKMHYYKHETPKAIFRKYFEDGTIHVLQDMIGDGEREIWYSYPDKETRERIKEELAEYNTPENRYDVTLTVLEEG